MSTNINEIIGSEAELYRTMGDNFKNTLRVAMPGIIQSFNSKEQTVTVQPVIREHVLNEDMSREWKNIPLLLDVPIVIPRAGGYSMTLPVKEGDECLVVFLDSCMDAWFSLGGIQNQIRKRRHDLSDAVAILGVYSQPNVIPNYSIDSAQLRNEDGTSYLELKDNEINIVSGSVNINGINFNTHTHTCPDGKTSEPN